VQVLWRVLQLGAEPILTLLPSGVAIKLVLLLAVTGMALSASSVSAQVGETWNFQAWYTDLNSSNFSDGLVITFL